MAVAGVVPIILLGGEFRTESENPLSQRFQVDSRKSKCEMHKLNGELADSHKNFLQESKLILAKLSLSFTNLTKQVYTLLSLLMSLKHILQI